MLEHDDHRLIKPVEAAHFLGLSRSWLAKLRLTGDGPLYMKAGRQVRDGQLRRFNADCRQLGAQLFPDEALGAPALKKTRVLPTGLAGRTQVGGTDEYIHSTAGARPSSLWKFHSRGHAPIPSHVD